MFIEVAVNTATFFVIQSLVIAKSTKNTFRCLISTFIKTNGIIFTIVITLNIKTFI